MNDKKILIIIHLLIPLFALHLVEEMKTGFYLSDSHIKYLSEQFNLTPQITFFLIQILLFSFLGSLLTMILLKKPIPLFLALILAVIALYEFTHIFEAIRIYSYSPGLITGVLIFLLGLALTFNVLKARKQ